GHSLCQGEWAADRLNPVADLRRIRVAHLHRRQWGTGLDVDHREMRRFVGSNYPSRAPQVLTVWIGGELYINLVGLLNHVIIRDDVALGADDEHGAERFANLPILAILIGNLATEELVEEVLEVVLTLTSRSNSRRLILIVVAVWVLRIWQCAAMRRRTTSL